jgi:hypothetical protein
MDNIPPLGTGADLELCAARIADPGIGQSLNLVVIPNLCQSRPQDEAQCSLRTA